MVRVSLLGAILAALTIALVSCGKKDQPEPEPESVASDSVVQPQSVSITDLPGQFESVWEP
jgi:nitrous oxide reductase accessory protein NosL